MQYFSIVFMIYGIWLFLSPSHSPSHFEIVLITRFSLAIEFLFRIFSIIDPKAYLLQAREIVITFIGRIKKREKIKII